MHIGIYIDGYNLYYGARSKCGKGTPGWRWLDPRALSSRLIGLHSNWSNVTLHVVYCTARVRGSKAGRDQVSQDAYLRALKNGHFVDVIELGKYVTRTAFAPLAVEDKRGRPLIFNPQWPIKVQDSGDNHSTDAVFIASTARRETQRTVWAAIGGLPLVLRIYLNARCHLPLERQLDPNTGDKKDPAPEGPGGMSEVYAASKEV